MPIDLNGQTYYRTADVCQMVGINRTTLFRWLKNGVLNEAERRDRRGWRLFSTAEVEMLKNEANRVVNPHETSLKEVGNES